MSSLGIGFHLTMPCILNFSNQVHMHSSQPLTIIYKENFESCFSVCMIVFNFDLWNSVEDILERYERYNHTECAGPDHETQVHHTNIWFLSTSTYRLSCKKILSHVFLLINANQFFIRAITNFEFIPTYFSN